MRNHETEILNAYSTLWHNGPDTLALTAAGLIVCGARTLRPNRISNEIRGKWALENTEGRRLSPNFPQTLSPNKIGWMEKKLLKIYE